MWFRSCIFLLLSCSALLTSSEPRRVRVRPAQLQDQLDDNVQYYTAEAQEGTDQALVLVSSADQYNGPYGQPSPSRNLHDNYIPQSRASVGSKGVRTKEPSKAPPVQTIRNYNKVNDDGSFTFGYEAADGSFKEETRGTDCVVRGKYGYVDPDGNKREFTYVSGNPCDPNAPKEEEEEEASPEASNEPENVPANYPTRPVRPLRPSPPPQQPTRPAVTFFQNDYQREEIEPEPEQVLQSVQPLRNRPLTAARPTYLQDVQEESIQVTPRPKIQISSTPSSYLFQESIRPVSVAPRPVTPAPTRTQLPATTYRPQLLQAVTPRPSLLYTKSGGQAFPSSTLSPLSPHANRQIDFDAEFQKFQQENSIVSATASPTPRTATIQSVKPTSSSPVSSASPIYSSQLIFDPSTGQYNTALYQTLPQTQGDFQLSHRIQPYVQQPQRPQLVSLQQLQQQSPLYRQPKLPSQAAYQQQQAELQFQNSQQLFAQQQQQRAKQQQQQHQQAQQAQPQPFYYIQPSSIAGQQQAQALTSSQIEAFLRGHNIQF